jgi:hypothetical protein
MAAEAFLPGYILYLLFIFAPGFGFSELLDLWSFENSVAGRFAISFGVGLSFDTLIIFIRTFGYAGLVGLDYSTVVFVILAGLIALGASVVIRRKLLLLPIKPQKTDYIVFALILILGGMILLHFQKYPIFPEYLSHDFGAHVQFSQDLISGAITSVPGGVLYDGIYYQLAPALLLIGGEPLITVQRVVGLLVVLSPLLMYLGAKMISTSERVGVISAALYALSGTVWFDGVFDSGLYANFIGILAALFLTSIVIMAVQKPRALTTWVAFLLALVNAYMSHYTILSLFPALLLLPLILFLFKKPHVKDYLLFGVVSVLPPIAAIFAIPTLADIVIPLLSSGRGAISGSTTLSSALSSVPVMSYMALEVYDDVAFIALLILAVVAVYFAIRRKDTLISIPVIWFLALLAVAPQNIAAWRYSYEAIVPILILAGYGLDAFFPSTGSTRSRSSLASKMRARRSESIIPRAIVIMLFFAAIVIGSWGQYAIADSLSNTAVIAQAQTQDYSAMQWLKENTPNGSQYLSTSDWNFVYTNLTIGRNSIFEYARTPSTAISAAENSSAQYIVVTNVATLSLPPVSSFYPWTNFPNSSTQQLTLAYSNPNVRIFRISNTTG